MEPVGLAASVVALVKVVDKSVEGARRIAQLWKDAPKDIKDLTEYLQAMQSLLAAIDRGSHGQANKLVSWALDQSVETAKELNRVLETEILAGGRSESSRSINAAWVRHRKKVSQLKGTLSEAQSQLIFALQASSKLRFDLLEGSPTGIPGSDVRISLSDSVAEMGTKAESTTLEQKTFLKPSLEIAMPDSDVSQDDQSGEDSSASLEIYSTPTQRLGPATSLECSPNFMPETYSMKSDPLIFYDSQEISPSMNQRDVTYTLLILRRRQFTRVTLHMEINRDSTYWPALRAKPANIGYRKAYEPPATLMEALDKFLQSRKNLPPQDAQIDLFLGHRQGKFKMDPNPQQRRKTQQYLQQISAKAVHMNFPRFKERELIHSPVSWKYEAVRVQAKMKSGWAIEVRFNARDDHMDEEWYALHILYSLRKSNGFGSLMGLVEDENGRISGFLCRNPSLGPLLDVLFRAKQQGFLVDWARRERWCRQIIEGISELHANDLRHGSLGRFLRNGLYIDEHDNVVFLNSFRDSFTYADDLHDLSIPPECQDMKDDFGNPAAPIPVQPATDLYQLGLILWCIAAHEEVVYRSTACEDLDIEAPEDEQRIGSDGHLPSIDPSKAPPFMNKVIAMCRAEKPEERGPAWELLNEFPAPAEVTGMPRISELSVDDKETPVEDDMVAWPINIRCRRCQAPTADHYYHCGRCLIRAMCYEICPRCFADGHHCMDDDHYLQELRKREPQGKYYSCVGADGHREVSTC
ncbi:hypothetical protein PG988_006647 [Apiospora saccharicola]